MTIEWNNVTEKKERNSTGPRNNANEKGNEPCVQWDSGRPPFSLVYIFILSSCGFSDLYVLCVVFFVLIGSCSFIRVFRRSFFSHLETENRGSRAPCESSVVEKRRETEGRTDAETRRYTPSWLRADSLTIIIDFGLPRSPNISAIVYDALELLHSRSDRNTISAAFTVTEIRWSELLQR